MNKVLEMKEKGMKGSVLFPVLCFISSRWESAAEGRQRLGGSRKCSVQSLGSRRQQHRCQRRVPVVSSWEVQDGSLMWALLALSTLLIPPSSEKSLTSRAQNSKRGVAAGPATLPVVGLWSGYSHLRPSCVYSQQVRYVSSIDPWGSSWLNNQKM